MYEKHVLTLQAHWFTLVSGFFSSVNLALQPYLCNHRKSTRLLLGILVVRSAGPDTFKVELHSPNQH